MIIHHPWDGGTRVHDIHCGCDFCVRGLFMITAFWHTVIYSRS